MNNRIIDWADVLNDVRHDVEEARDHAVNDAERAAFVAVLGRIDAAVARAHFEADTAL